MGTPLTATLPLDDTAFVADLHRRYASKTLRALLTLPRAGLGAGAQRGLAALQGALGAAFRDARDATLGAVVHPTVSTLVACLGRLDDAPESARARAAYVDALVPTAAFQLALAGLLPDTPLPLDAHVPTLASPAHELRLDLAGHTRVAGFSRHALHLLRPEGARTVDLSPRALGALRTRADDDLRGAAAFPEVAPGLVLALHDNNPLWSHELHPDKSGNALDLGERPVAEWLDALRAALALVEVGLPLVRAELGVLLRQAVPVGWYAERHLSASYFEAIGTIYLSLHGNVVTMAEAVVHEFQHNKLNALLHFDPLLMNGYTAWTKSPVRPDLRPLMGVLLAVHAFVPVAELYLGLRAADAPPSRGADFARRYRVIVDKNEEGLATLRGTAEPTEAGAELLAELERWHARHRAAPLYAAAADAPAAPASGAPADREPPRTS